MFSLVRSAVQQSAIIRSVGCRYLSKYPAAIGPYSACQVRGDTMYVSGCLGLKPEDAELVTGGVRAETKRALANMEAILEEKGFKMSDVVKTTVLLTDMADFNEANGVYQTFFSEPFPARMCYAVKALPKGGLVEIDAVAVSQ